MKYRLSPLGLGSTQTATCANGFGNGPHATLRSPLNIDRARLPRNAIARGAYRRILASSSLCAARNSFDRNFGGYTTWSAHHCGETTAVIKKAPFFVRTKDDIREARFFQHAPKPVAAVREVMALKGGRQAGIQTTKHYVQTWREDVQILGVSFGSRWHALYLALTASGPAPILHESIDR